MNILLIYPEYPDTFWGVRHALKFVGKKAPFPPLGLLTVAAMLPEAWSKRLFFWSLIRRPRLFSLAITFAIYGYHFRKITENMSWVGMFNDSRSLDLWKL